MIISKLDNGSVDYLKGVVLGGDFSKYKDEYYLYHTRKFVSICDHPSLPLKHIRSGRMELSDEFFDSKGQMKLILPEKSKQFSDFENCRLVYDCFRSLTPLQANDPRLWVKLTHDHCHKYVVHRWMKSNSTERAILDRFFFKGVSQSSRVRNAISRLWWIAHLTIDENQEDKWYYTRIMCSSQDIITSLLERRLGVYKNVRFGFLQFYDENPKIFSGSSRTIQKLLRDLNNMGGVRLLASFSIHEIKAALSRLSVMQ